MADPIIAPTLGWSLVDTEGKAQTEFNTWMADISLAVNDLRPLTGDGSPEGVVIARPSRWYVDTTANVIYFKEIGDGDTGWVLES